MADKADWCDANVRHFIDVCKGEIDAGNRPMGMFTKTGWKNLRTKHEEKTGQKLNKKQLKNKLDNMKKEYTWFMEFKNYATGLGWDEAKQTVDCSKEWWDEHLAVRIKFPLLSIYFPCFISYELLTFFILFQRCNNPGKGIKCNHVRFRKQGPKHLDDLHILFDKVHVSGATASEQDILPLLKEVHTIYQNFSFVLGVLLKGSTRCSISCIHPYGMSLSGLLES